MANKKQKVVKEHKFPSELRLDLVSRDWVVIATGRAKRPETFKKEEKEEVTTAKKDCPFCQIHTQEEPKLIFANGKSVSFEGWNKLPKNWSVIVIPNKYPAFSPHPDLDRKIEGGLYQTINAVGYHEVVVTKDHKKHLGEFSIEATKRVFDAYHSRYLFLMKEKFVNHISIFHNHGKKAGASIAHPHSQIITTPLIDVDLRSALLNSKIYSKNKNKCVYCRMNDWEMKVKERIVFENKGFLVVCPFASKTAFQIIISPKKHLSYFEKITEGEKWELSEAFHAALSKMNKGLNNPDYNFYLHSSPCDGKDHSYYHWHWTILPKTSTWAGFEMGTKIEISTIEPEKAAEYLKKQ